MSNEHAPIRRGIRSMKGWMLRMPHSVTSTGNSEARHPGKRRFGLDDRRLATRAEPSNRRIVERRDT